jgi:hypothetical protein
MPTPTDLVTDLPADFEVFGQAVDTSLADLQGGTTGQILAKASNTNMDFAWITNDVGDITAVNVTSPITGGGSSGSVTIAIQDATTSVKGAVQLSDSTSTTSSVLASTPTATKSAYDLADAAIAKSTLTTAGDTLYRNATVPVRLGIGTAGQVLTVNSGATAPEWATPASGANAFYAGKNKIINGDFNINQRTFTSNTTAGTFNFDRFYQNNSGGSFTVTPQTFTLGAAPVVGYEGKNYLQGITASQSAAGDFAFIGQNIEGVRSFAGQTVTISFWAKANTGTPKIAVELSQYFGTGGSPSATVSTAVGQVILSTSWTRQTITVVVPSISGKTIGTNNNDSLGLILWTSAGSTFNARTGSLGIQNFTADIWGVQVEAGSSATDFQTASGSLQGELALCQRYYFRRIAEGTNSVLSEFGGALSTTSCRITINPPVTMRVLPTAVDFTALTLYDAALNSASATGVTVNSSISNKSLFYIAVDSTGLTQYRNYQIISSSSSGYLGFSAEL